MKILFLGTGAADFPERKEGVSGFRRTASALVDGVLLIDPGPWVLDAIKEYGVDDKSIKYIINTHRHGDHYSQSTVDFLLSAGAQFVDIKAGEKITLGDYYIEAYKGNHTIDVCHFIIKDGEKVGVLQKMKNGKWEFDSTKYNIVGATFGSLGMAKSSINSMIGG